MGKQFLINNGKKIEASLFKVNRGSDLQFLLQWPDGPGTADLTGYAVNLFEPDSKLDGLITATLTDPATGSIRVRVEWDDALPTAEPMTFRLQIDNGAGEQQSTNLLAVTYE